MSSWGAVFYRARSIVSWRGLKLTATRCGHAQIGETLWTKDFTRPRTRTVMRRKTNRFSVAPDDGGTPLVSEEGEEEYEAVEEEIIEEKKCHHIQSIQIAVTMFAALMSGTYYAYGL